LLILKVKEKYELKKMMKICGTINRYDPTIGVNDIRRE
jgi:hypothetical protein